MGGAVGPGLALSALGGSLLAGAFLNPSLFILAWVSFVPLLLAAKGRGPWGAYLAGLVFGLAAYGIGAHWITHFFGQFFGAGIVAQMGAAGLFVLLAAQLPAILMAIRALFGGAPWADFAVFPALAALLHAYFPALFPTQLGSSQSGFLVALQPISHFGTIGLDAIIVLANVALFRLTAKGLGGPVLALGVVGAWIGTGALMLSRADEAASPDTILRIGIVQPDEPPRAAADAGPGREAIFALTEALARTEPDLILWPETRAKGYFQDARITAAFADLARRTGTPILFQDLAPVSEDRVTNSAVLLDDGGRAQGRYDKLYPMPVGETLPLLRRVPVLETALRRGLGAGFTIVEPGRAPVRIPIDTGDRTIGLLPLICYETLLPRAAAGAARLADAAPSVLVGMASDGWFGEGAGPRQHVRASALRAVETGLPMVLALNNGPSAVIAPTGRFLTVTPVGEAGGYLVRVPVVPPGRTPTPHSRAPWAVPAALLLVLVGGLLLQAWKTKRR